MANVTVLGAGGATVTISLSSADNAAAAQIAANFINALTEFKLLDQQTWSGSGTLPGPQALLSGVIIGGAGTVIGTAGDLGTLTHQYVSVAVNAAGESTVIGAQNFNTTAIFGDSSAVTYGNQSQNAEVFFGNGSNVLLNFQGHANMTGTDGTYIIETDSDASTTATIGGKAILLFSDLSGNSGANIVNLAAGSNATVSAAGASTIPATINAVDGKMFVAIFDKGHAVINPGAANVTVVGAVSAVKGSPTGVDYGGAATLFGGTGSVVVSGGQGVFTGGLAGNNLMFTSTVAGSATLTGGGSGDLVIAQGSGQLLIAGAGNETLYARAANSTGANTFFAGNGFTTVFGGQQGGNTYVFSGLGASEVDGRDEAAAGVASQNTYLNVDVDGNAATGGTHFIGDFLTGVDTLQISTADTAVVTYFAPGASGSPMGTIGGTQVLVSSGATYNFFESGALGQDIFDSDITKA